jgi:hypothetical protein
MAKKRGKMPSAPIKAPGGNIKGIGPLGTFEGGLVPLVVDPKYGPNPKPAKSIIKGNIK